MYTLYYSEKRMKVESLLIFLIYNFFKFIGNGTLLYVCSFFKVLSRYLTTYLFDLNATYSFNLFTHHHKQPCFPLSFIIYCRTFLKILK